MGDIPIEVDDVATAELNEEIITLKKKIQLSEGQRKAQYEEYDSEKKKQAEEIRRVKKEIKESVVIKPSDIDEELIRHSGLPIKDLREYLNKPPEEVKRILDLKNIDLQKKLDLMKYEIFRKQDRILQITNIMEDILMETDQDIVKRYAAPIQKEVSRLENRIHLVYVNILELRHMQKKYLKIKESLQEDSVFFESTLKKSDEDLQKQKNEIARLQVVKDEALRMRDKTRNALAVLEAQVISEGLEREAELQGLRKKVEEGKAYLERVERSLAPSIKPLTHQESEENMIIESEEAAAKEAIEKALAKLKHVTGAKDEVDIIKKFKTQKDTKERLVKLKETVEKEKRELEKKKEKLEAELEAQKFAQVKEKEQNEEELERLKLSIHDAKKQRDKMLVEHKRDKKQLENIISYFHRLSITLEKYKDKEKESEIDSSNETIFVMDTTKMRVEALVKDALEKGCLALLQQAQGEEPLGLEEETRPEKKSEGEKEADKGELPDVPTRSFLKRQSQLIVEAKTRRKGFNRDPIPAFK